MSLSEKLVFIAGATGLAGTSIIQHLVAQYPEIRIRATFYKNTKPHFLSKNIEWVYGDLTQKDDCVRLIKGCDCAVMAAAYSGGILFTSSNPWMHAKQNLLMNIQMLEAFKELNVNRVIYIGSSTLYQEFEGFIKEDEIDLNQDPYKGYFGFGWSARVIEKYCKLFHDHFGMDIIIVRSSNIYGPFARFDPKTSNFIPAIIRKATQKMDPFEVWGDSEIVRDVIYSNDFAKAIIMLLEKTDIKYDIFNIGTGSKTTVGDVVKLALLNAQHKPLKIVYNQQMPSALKFRVLDCSKIKNIVGWEPCISIEEGIRLTTAWWNENKEWWNK
jgi:GDP-L-fucose synthase